MIAGNSSLPNSIVRWCLIANPSRYLYHLTARSLHFGLTPKLRKRQFMKPGGWPGFNLVMNMGIGCFVNQVKSADKRGAECASGVIDMMDATVAEAKVSPEHLVAKVSPEHLVVMVHGLIGSASDWKFAAQEFVKRLPDSVVVHRSECNAARLTFDGVDLMGERLANEVLAVVRRWPGVQKISFVAHSLGGLVARYAIGRLYEPCLTKENSVHLIQNLQESRIAGLEPMNFITFATPHLGSRGNKQLPFLCGLSFLERHASQNAHLVAGRSGKHLFLTDNDGGKPPLLLRMATDTDGMKFISALRSFKHRVAYANVNFDHVVGWRTSAIRRQHELPKVNVLMSGDKYPHIVYIEHETFEDALPQASSHVEHQEIDYEEEMVRGLTQVPWERVHVSFHKSKQRFVAHNTIQVKSYWLNSDGADVIFHMIDHFLL